MRPGRSPAEAYIPDAANARIQMSDWTGSVLEVIRMSHAATTAKREDAVLVVIDIQERLAVTMPERDRVNVASGKLARTAAIVGVPIVVTRQYPKGLGDFESPVRAAVEQAAENVPVTWADKMSFDCFAEPAFTEALSATGRKQLLITGMESHICVAQTTLSALELGFDVHVIADACCSRDATAHAIAMDRLRAAGAVVTTTESVLYELVGVAGTDEFRALLKIVKE
jgi:nicotinamidase-related amidase